jgi:1,4-dihydroxy-2-naphthoyl-CoA hydrolase
VTDIDQKLTDFTHATMPFAATIGFEVVSGTTDQIVARAEWAQERCTVGTALHGGYLMSLADSAGGLLASLNLPPGAGTSTIESKTNFIRGATEGPVTITSTLVHAGRTTIVVQTDITRPDGKLATRTTQTQAVLAPRS